LSSRFEKSFLSRLSFLSLYKGISERVLHEI